MDISQVSCVRSTCPQSGKISVIYVRATSILSCRLGDSLDAFTSEARKKLRPTQVREEQRTGLQITLHYIRFPVLFFQLNEPLPRPVRGQILISQYDCPCF
jgi:hypothetical protein